MNVLPTQVVRYQRLERRAVAASLQPRRPEGAATASALPAGRLARAEQRVDGAPQAYIDIALHSMEHRLLVAMSGGGDAPAMHYHGARPAFGAKLGAANAAGPVTSLALASVKEEEQALLEQAIGETERDRQKREAEEEAKAMEKKHAQEVKQREKFMAKYSGKEIYGEKENRCARTQTASPFLFASHRAVHSPFAV